MRKPYFPGSPRLQQNLAKLSFYSGEQDRAFEMLNKLLEAPNRPSIPVLLYHGITVSDRQDTMPLQKFRDQLMALKQEGYQSVTMGQLLTFFDGHEALPAKPILITFDDARADSFQYADPILTETGFRATMFVPVADVGTRGAYTAVWSTIRRMLNTGRWDLQCHGVDAQHYIPVDAEGHLGRFLANRMWLDGPARLESDEEFTARLDKDFRQCREVLSREVPGSQPIAYAFPYSDPGHRSLSNEPAAFKLNHDLVARYFRLAFHVENDDLVTRDSPRFALPRFEVPRNFTAKDLVKQLKTIDPVASTSYELALLYVNAGRYSQAMQIFDRLEREGAIDSAKLLTTTGKVLNWSGDYAGARERFEKAMALRPDDPAIQQEIAALERRIRPVVQINGLYFEDNAHRSYYSVSPSVQFYLSDKLSLSAYYKYLNADQTIDLGTSQNVDGRQHFQAIGNQFEGQLSYELGRRSSLSLSAGAADFSGQSSPASSTSSPTFPLGSIKLNVGVGDSLDLSIGADHNYVNTAGAILTDIAYTRALGGFKLKAFDSLSLAASHAFLHYTDNNQRNRTDIRVDNRLWSNPDITIGAQFIREDTLEKNPLFWSPNNYLGLTAPFILKAKLGESLVAEVTVAPGVGKEAGEVFKFQLNAGGNMRWNLSDDFSLYVSASQYQAATYSSFTVFVGASLGF